MKRLLEVVLLAALLSVCLSSAAMAAPRISLSLGLPEGLGVRVGYNVTDRLEIDAFVGLTSPFSDYDGYTVYAGCRYVLGTSHPWEVSLGIYGLYQHTLLADAFGPMVLLAEEGHPFPGGFFIMYELGAYYDLVASHFQLTGLVSVGYEF